jgi:hypothetical protein
VLLGLVCVGIISSGWRMVSAGLVWSGFLLLGVGAVTALLVIRRQVGFGRSTDSLGLDRSGALGPAAFDDLIWTAVGVPVILIIGVLVFALTGAR